MGVQFYCYFSNKFIYVLYIIIQHFFIKEKKAFEWNGRKHLIKNDFPQILITVKCIFMHKSDIQIVSLLDDPFFFFVAFSGFQFTHRYTFRNFTLLMYKNKAKYETLLFFSRYKLVLRAENSKRTKHLKIAQLFWVLFFYFFSLFTLFTHFLMLIY